MSKFDFDFILETYVGEDGLYVEQVMPRHDIFKTYLTYVQSRQ